MRSKFSLIFEETLRFPQSFFYLFLKLILSSLTNYSFSSTNVSEKLAVLFVKISFCYVLCNEGFFYKNFFGVSTIAATYSYNLDQLSNF
jgi:hypothetical protein